MISQVMHAQAVSGPVGVSLQAGSGGVPRGASGCLCRRYGWSQFKEVSGVKRP